MKKFYFLIVFLIAGLLVSCENDDVPVETHEVAVPVTMTIADFRASVSLQEPMELEESGKIYVYGNYIFVNDLKNGILVLDNKDHTPQKKKFIKIPQNTDMAVKGDVLFANSGRDLVTFDISDMENIKFIERLEDVFDHYYPQWPESAAYVDFSGFDSSKEIIVGYTTERREVEMQHETGWERFSGDILTNSGGNSGTGGSMARFNIGGNYLYTVGESNLTVFNISNLSSPQQLASQYVGWRIETIFNKEGYLYLGSATGLYIYSLEDPSSPEYMSEIRHVVGCDPVVVENDMAYVTIRGGNMCGQNLNQLEVIDVSDKRAPRLLEIYEMDGPYGLGIRNDQLFVCDGTSGLKVYDATNTPELTLTSHFREVNAFDVIPMEDALIMIGGNMINQYSYKNNSELELISSFELN